MTNIWPRARSTWLFHLLLCVFFAAGCRCHRCERLHTEVGKATGENRNTFRFVYRLFCLLRLPSPFSSYILLFCCYCLVLYNFFVWLFLVGLLLRIWFLRELNGPGLCYWSFKNLLSFSAFLSIFMLNFNGINLLEIKLNFCSENIWRNYLVYCDERTFSRSKRKMVCKWNSAA